MDIDEQVLAECWLSNDTFYFTLPSRIPCRVKQ